MPNNDSLSFAFGGDSAWQQPAAGAKAPAATWGEAFKEPAQDTWGSLDFNLGAERKKKAVEDAWGTAGGSGGLTFALGHGQDAARAVADAWKEPAAAPAPARREPPAACQALRFDGGEVSAEGSSASHSPLNAADAFRSPLEHKGVGWGASVEQLQASRPVDAFNVHQQTELRGLQAMLLQQSQHQHQNAAQERPARPQQEAQDEVRPELVRQLYQELQRRRQCYAVLQAQQKALLQQLAQAQADGPSPASMQVLQQLQQLTLQMQQLQQQQALIEAKLQQVAAARQRRQQQQQQLRALQEQGGMNGLIQQLQVHAQEQQQAQELPRAQNDSPVVFDAQTLEWEQQGRAAPQQQQPQQNGAWSAAASPQQEPALAEAPSPEHRVCSGNSMRSRFTNGTYVRFSHTPHDDMVQFDGDSLHNAAALYSRNAEVVSCSSVRSPVPSFTTGGSPGSEIDLAVPTRAGLAFDAKCEFFSQGGGDDMVLRANFEAVPSGGEPAHPARPESTAVPLPPAAVPVQHPRGDAGYSPTVKPPKNPAAALTSPEGDHGGHAFTHSSGTAAPTTTTTTTTTPSRGGTSTATGSACAPAPGGKPASSGSKASWKAPSVEHDGDADLPEVDTAFTPPFRLNKKHPAAEREGDAAARGRVRALSGGALAKAAEAPGRIGYSPTVRTQVVPAGLADASAVVNTEEGPAGDDEGEDEEEAEDDGEGAPERARPAMLDDTMKLDAEANQAAAAAAYMPDDEEEDEEFEEESEADDGGHSPHDGAPQPEALFERSAAAVAAVGEAPGASRPRQHSNHQPRPFVDDAPIFKMRKSLHDTVNSAHGATTSSQDTAATEPMAPPAVHKTQVLTDEEDGGDAGDVGLRPTRPRQESDWESAGVTRGVSPVFKFRRNMNRPVPSSSVDDASASLASTLAQSRVDDRSCVVASLDEQGFVASLNEQGFAECVQSAEAAAEEDTGAGVETDSAAPRRRSSHRGSVLHCTTCGHPNQRNTRGVVRFCRACGSMIVASPRPAKTQASPPPPPAAVVSKCAVGAEGAEGGVPMPIAHGLLGAKDDMGEEETLDENIAREKDVCVDEAEQGCKDDVALEEVADDVEDGLPAYADSADNDSAEADEPCDAAGADPDVFQHVKDAIADAEPPQDEHGWYPTMPEDADDAADDDTAAADDAPHGAPVPVFECPGCGVLVRYGVRFCKECGTGLAGVGMASAEEEEEDEDADDDEGRVESAAAAVHPAPQPAAPDGGPADASAPPPAAPPAALVEGEAPPEGDDAKRVPCEWCGRAFLQDRLEKHEPICKKHTLKKREREMLKAHKEQEKQRQNPAKPAPKTTWREKTSQLRAAMKNARAVDRALKAGKDLKDIPQAPPDEHDDRVTCPHCHRKFAQQAADRHIPLCATMKSRPRPVKKPAARPRGGGGGGGGGGGDAGQCIAEQEQNLQDLVTVRRRDMEENLVRARNDMKRVTAERDAPWTPGGAGPPTKVKHFKDRFRIKDPQQLPAFPCPYCGYRAVNTQSLEVHLKTCGLGKAGVAAVHNQALEARVRALERLVTAADTAPPQAPKSIGAAPASSSSQSAEQQLATTTDIKSALEQAKQNVMQLERKLVDREKAKGAGEGGGGATPPLPPPPLDGGGDSGRDGPPPPPAPAPAPSSARKSVHFAEEGEGGASSAPTPLAGACARAPMAQRKPVAKHPLRSQAEGLRYSNMVSRLYDDEIKSAGAGGPPAAKAKNPDDSRTQCPYCGRKFAGAVAQRHIPKCAATASFVPPSTKKPPVNKQGGAEPRSRS
eukprot:TRINITY_DN3040_c0_g1_i1.p1 TRINITY_DN3040_c0_g1~~TRINITY_DN3040_c0_g1_i1.p1  ORF type:complete len:1780 (+),score=594.79 TRINITY_DN3040_c0_g1_i1:255-5594(+)